MRSAPRRLLVWGAVAVIGAAPGCSTGGKNAPSAAVTSAAGLTAAAPARPGTVSLSPAGVTTKIDVPAHSTEEEYFQACHAASIWMKGHPADRRLLVETYLAAVQKPGAVGPGTWNTPWAALSLPQQAGVIVAAKAAANDECG
ncbi:lipoprotein LpqV [Mycobacterium cookii]|uniref:Putative lipoprotein LpqV n=1 Tax=Mycobacterium cookii TaxID=1775 RepID=A0A7I7KW61_9MYCO|nr:lipoprotein LpqV [Mycobacterium cookii]MCV7331833.1 lipoprotein LpqV [Mycobacterium cookii]BBX46064.1 putative lipoprotein LpqV [Mycobacterium cookii]